MGHARALITAEDPDALARHVVRKGLSVRQTEQLAKTSGAGTKAKPDKTATRKGAEKDADTRALENDLSANLGMKVSIDHPGGSKPGTMSITYKNLGELDDLCRLLSATLPDY